ncbi:MAG: molybdopterin-dependent oxidoreductase [Haloplanus sp.]
MNEGDTDGWRVTLVGDGERVIEVPSDAPERAVTASLQCSTGTRWTDEWRGVPVAWLLERAPGGDEATHLRVHGPDDHVVCVPLTDALDGVLAVERTDGRLAASARPRFVAPCVGGTRSVKAVERLELVALSPGDEAASYESLAPAE